jgi:hypothetical protein
MACWWFAAVVMEALVPATMTAASIATTHTSGVNWPQALAIWVPIVIGLLTIGGLATRVITRIAGNVVKDFASTLNVRLSDLDVHLASQDKRFDRLDRKLKIDSK